MDDDLFEDTMDGVAVRSFAMYVSAPFTTALHLSAPPRALCLAEVSMFSGHPQSHVSYFEYCLPNLIMQRHVIQGHVARLSSLG
jgi:hypothetical protein